MSDEAFFTLHRDLPREGPGTAEDVHWALSVIDRPHYVIDAGCGPGADTETLAEALPEARIDAVDQVAHFVAEARALTERFGPRVTVRVGDMAALHGPADLIWCAGAVYFLGLEAALAQWRPVLAPGGAVAFSEAVFLTDPPGRAARDFWALYPAMGSEAALQARIAAAGYRTLASRRIVGPAWSAYYEPLAARIARLRPGADAELAAVLDEAESEIALWRAARGDVAYSLCVVTPR
ncbi:MAG: class I SAM-dependent methyltransferase [Paracoccaceae bacterium]